MPRIVFHIGTYKTGSTAIQQIFQEKNRSSLSALGWMAPKTGSVNYESGAFHHPIAWSLQGQIPDDQRRALFDNLLSEIEGDGSENIFISTELFCSLALPKIDMLSAELGRYPVTVVVYLRRQDEMLHSLYLTSIWYERARNSIPPDRDRHLNEFVYVGDYASILKNWHMAFPHAEFLIRIYDAEVARNGVVSDFLSLFGLPASQLQSDVNVRVNEHLPARLIEFVRMVNRTDLPVDAHRDMVIALRDIVRRGEIDLGPNKRWFISNQQRCDIIDRYAQSNSVLERDWLRNSNKAGFSGRRPDATEPFEPVRVSSEEAAEIAALLWKEQWARRQQSETLGN